MQIKQEFLEPGHIPDSSLVTMENCYQTSLIYFFFPKIQSVRLYSIYAILYAHTYLHMVGI